MSPTSPVPADEARPRAPRRRLRPGLVALAIALTVAAAAGIAWPEIAAELQAWGIGRPNRLVELFGCVVLWVASMLFASAAAHESGRRAVSLVLVATGAATLAAATAATASGSAHTVGLITVEGPTTAQLLAVAVLVSAICALPSRTPWSAVLVIDAGLGAVAAISLTWLAPLRTSAGPGGGLADVMAREPGAAVLVALMVAGVVLLVRVVGMPRPGDLALVVAVLLVPSALYVSILGQFALPTSAALRTSTLWWMTGPTMLLVAGWQSARGEHLERRLLDVHPTASAGHEEAERGSDGAWVAAAATLLSLGAVATHRLFIASLDPVMLTLGVIAVGLSTLRLALSQRDQARLQERLGAVAAALHRRARTDELTGLGNRLALVELLEGSTAAEVRPIAAFYADVDEFKSVNDALGHDVGDQLLVGVAHRLLEVLGPAVHRVGGDEFVAVCPGVTATRASELASSAVEASMRPLHLDGVAVPARISIGTAVLEADQDDAAPDGASTRSDDEVVRMADLALNRAKELGRGRAIAYEDWLRERADHRAELTRVLRGAVERAELEVRYRPVVDIADGRISGAEAILRWRTPEGRLLAPEEYLEIATDTGLLPSISRLGLQLATSPWHSTAVPDEDLELVLSATRQELAHIGYVEELTGVLGGIGCTCVQIAESVLMDPAVQSEIDRLVGARIPVRVREFGTATSSIRRLRRLHRPSIRIDASFTAGLEDREPDRLIVGAVSTLGAELGAPVVADGVTRPGQIDRLRDLGVERAQGWLFGPPTSWSDFADRHLDPNRAPSALEWRPPARRPGLVEADGDVG
ncbi:MAG: EAL domain-containing protein [Actinobacteria bacterium]|nr:EAL domain-containing protein [Actinomycetota bacterium]